MKMTTISVTQGQYNKLKNEGQRLGSSMASIVRMAVDKYFCERSEKNE